MKKLQLFLFFSICCICVNSQPVTAKLKFEQGQNIEIELQAKTNIAQQAMGQAFDFSVDAHAGHAYKVTNATDENTTLHHVIKRIWFSFDGMGQKTNFDSNKEKDMNGPFGKSMKELLNKKFDVIIDTAGKVLVAIPEKVTISESDNRMAVISSMLKDITDLVHPPKKGQPGFFNYLPENEIVKGRTWTNSTLLNGNKHDGAYSIAEINDSTIIIDFVESSVTITKVSMMGTDATTTMNNKSTGKTILDRFTGIIKEKNSVTESNGNTEGSFGTIPVTSKTTATIKVRYVD